MSNWYIDNQAVGTNDGTSWINAWQSFAAVAWSSVQPGDTVYISGGNSSTTYLERLTIGKAGTSGNLITVSTGQDAGHNGLVIIDGQNILGLNSRGIDMNDYVRLTGLVGQQKNLLVRNFVCSTTDRDIGGGAAIWAASNIIIENMRISHVMNGLYCNGPTGVEIRYCVVDDVHGDVAFRFAGYIGTDFLTFNVHDNVVSTNSDWINNTGGPDGVQAGNGLTMYNNVFRCVSGDVLGGQHPDGVQAQGSYHKIYNNYFANYTNSAIKPGNTVDAAFWQEVYVYNNIITLDTSPLPTGLERGIEAGPDVGIATGIKNIYIVNNTLVDVNFIGINGGASAGTIFVSGVVIENNIIYNCGVNAGGTVITWNNFGITTGVLIDYNLINSGTIGGTGISFNGNSSGQSHGTTGVPSFVSYFSRNPTNNFHLLSTDMFCINKGTDISSFYTGFSLDKDGTIRPNGLGWDIGAYEFISSSIRRLGAHPKLFGLSPN